jgi:hypothetical protein
MRGSILTGTCLFRPPGTRPVVAALSRRSFHLHSRTVIIGRMFRAPDLPPPLGGPSALSTEERLEGEDSLSDSEWLCGLLGMLTPRLFYSAEKYWISL